MIIRVTPRAARDEPAPAAIAASKVVIQSRPMRVLDFDVEARPLHWISGDYVSKEITAIAWAWCDNPADVTCHLLGESDPVFMLREFVSAYNNADMVTGHFIRCMTPETRVLTDDLQWRQVGDMRRGDALLAFDEMGTPGLRRRMARATVVSNRARRETVYAVETDTGQVMFATAEHPWFACSRSARNAMRFHWRRTDELLGAPPSGPGKFAKGPAWLYQVFDTWEPRDTRETGWLAGFFDGEGTLGRSGSAGAALQVTAAQNPGATLEHAVNLLQRNGFRPVVGNRSDILRAKSLRINGGINDAIRFLGQVRPVRLLRNWQDFPVRQALRQIRMVRVVSVTKVGTREISALSTTTRTYIAEGFAVHNSYDLPMINGSLTEYNLPVLGDKLTQDTKLDLVRRAGLSGSQENIGTMLNLHYPKVKMDQAKWRDANRLTAAGRALARERVTGDVRQHIEMRAKLLALGYLGSPKVWTSGNSAPAESYTP